MQTDNPFLNDLSKLASGAAGALQGVKQEVEAMVRQRMERILADLDLVQREEFEAVKAMARKAREENESLAKRVAELEAALAAKPAAAKTAKPRTRSATARKPQKKAE